MKLNDDGVVLCQTENCELLATHTLRFHDDWVCYCIICAERAVGIGEFMGHHLPGATVRPMTPNEMVPDEERIE